VSEGAINAAGIFSALRVWFGSSAALVREVPAATGYAGPHRTIDALAVGTWPSKGLSLHAIEIKASRGDLLRELRCPEKSLPFRELCDGFSLAMPAGLLREGDQIPDGWGVIEVSADQAIRVTKKAAMREPAPVPRSFVSAIARSCANRLTPEDQISTEVSRHTADARARVGAELRVLRARYRASQSDCKHANDRLNELRAELSAVKCQVRRLGEKPWSTEDWLRLPPHELTGGPHQ
jgi:hypothetical protein